MAPRRNLATAEQVQQPGRAQQSGQQQRRAVEHMGVEQAVGEGRRRYTQGYRQRQQSR